MPLNPQKYIIILTVLILKFLWCYNKILIYFCLYGIWKVCRYHYYSGKMADDEEYEEVIEVRRKPSWQQSA